MMGAVLITVEKLTTWRVLPGGTQISLDLAGTDGATHQIVLPVDTLSGLMMTLPRMLQSALDECFPDGSFRIVQWLANWQLEQQIHGAELILKLGTKGGFKVAFVLNNERASRIGAALLHTPRDVDATLTRRLN